MEKKVLGAVFFVSFVNFLEHNVSLPPPALCYLSFPFLFCLKALHLGSHSCDLYLRD